MEPLFLSTIGTWNKEFPPARNRTCVAAKRRLAGMVNIRFSADDLDLFSSVSHDRNPLHISDSYARRSAYGSRVVFGVLNTITALGRARTREERLGSVLSRIETEFFDVALTGIDYGVAIGEETPSQTIVRVSDGRRPLLEIALTFRPGQPENFEQTPGALPLLTEAKDFRSTDIQVGRRISGRYAACAADMAAICARTGWQQPWVTAREVSALLWASYLVGMELPGQRALFSRLIIEFEPSVQASSPFDFDAEVSEVGGLNEVTIRAALSSDGKIWANSQLFAYVREDLPPATTAAVEDLVGRSDALSGKVAVVSGGSRGLGAALVRALALHGCTVVLNFLQGKAEAEQVRDSVSTGKVLLEQGNVADVGWCRDLQERLSRTLRQLDFLFCNASPPLLPLWLEPSAAVRVNEFVATAVAMVCAPMAAFMPLIADRKGWSILISSTAVTQIHPYFPHYVTAKAAAEAMVRAAAAEYRSVSWLIVRPARLLTDLTNTPLGRRAAVPPERVAAAIVKRLRESPHAGKVEVVDQF